MKNSLIYSTFLLFLFISAVSAVPRPQKSVPDNQILAPASENGQYKGITLNNGMQVLLVSNPSAVLAGVAIEVGMGSYSDPDYMPGLAHFIEHTIVMGSKGWPGTNDFYDLLAENGGSSNAFTSGEVTDTNYQVNTDALAKSLEILADMYQYPLFPYTTCQLESFAIESEFQLNYNTLFYRIYGVLLDLYDDDTPANHFSVGNYKTLVQNQINSGKNFSEELLKHQNQYYSTHLMTMAIISNDTIEAMQEMVETYFEGIPRKPDLPDSLYKDLSLPLSENLGTYAQVLAGEDDSDTVMIMFQLPPARDNIDVNPIEYLIYLLSDDGPGSLSSYLKSTNLAYYCSVTLLENTSFYTIVTFEIGVGPAGLARVDFLVRVVLDYIKFLTTAAINEDVYKAYANAKRIGFDYGDSVSQEPMDQASTLAQHISAYGLEHAFSESSLLNKFDPAVLQATFSQLNANNMVIVVASKAFVVDPSILPETTQDPRTIGDPLKAAGVTIEAEGESTEAELNPAQFLQTKSFKAKVEKEKVKRELLDSADFVPSSSTHVLAFGTLDMFLPNYNATYTYNRIPDSFYAALVDQALIDQDNALFGIAAFKLPDIDGNFPSNFGLICNTTDQASCKEQYEADASNPLENITLNDNSIMWYQLERSYLVPRLVVSLILHSPNALNSIEDYAEFMIFCTILKDLPELYLTDFVQGDFQTNFDCVRGHAYIFVEGFSDKMDDAINALSQGLRSLAEGNVAFSTYRRSAAWDVDATDTDPEDRVRVLLGQVLNEKYYSGEELVHAIDDISESQWSVTYVGTKKFYYEGLVIGNVLQDDAANYVETLISALNLELIDKSEIPSDQSRLFNGVYDVYREWNGNPQSNDNEIYNYYQTGERTHKTEAILIMLEMQFRNEAFDELRNRRQLGYVVFGGYKLSRGVAAFDVEIEGPVKNPEELDQEIENFLNEFYHYLRDLTAESFQNIKNAFLSAMSVPPLTLYDKANRYLDQITARTYEFDHSAKLVEAASNFTKDEIVQFYNEKMKQNPNKISLQIWKVETGVTLPGGGLLANETFAQKEEIVFEDIKELVASL